MTERERYVAEVVANPKEDLPRLAFADWCDEHGEAARAAFIRNQIERANLPPLHVLHGHFVLSDRKMIQAGRPDADPLKAGDWVKFISSQDGRSSVVGVVDSITPPDANRHSRIVELQHKKYPFAKRREELGVRENDLLHESGESFVKEIAADFGFYRYLTDHGFQGGSGVSWLWDRGFISKINMRWWSSNFAKLRNARKTNPIGKVLMIGQPDIEDRGEFFRIPGCDEQIPASVAEWTDARNSLPLVCLRYCFQGIEFEIAGSAL